MMDGTRRVTFEDVEVITGDLALWCRVNGTIVAVPRLGILPGSQIRRAGDRGRLVLAHDVAEHLELLA